MRLRAVYLFFLMSCVLFIYPLVLREPLKIGGFFGIGNANLVPDDIKRLIFYAITFVVMIFAGWLSLLAVIKDRRMLKGSISNHKCSFTINKHNSLFTCRVK